MKAQCKSVRESCQESQAALPAASSRQQPHTESALAPKAVSVQVLPTAANATPDESSVVSSQSQTLGMDNTGASGRWTDEEHRKFLEAYKIYGRNWKLVHKYVGTRSATQARSHAQKYFVKLEKQETKQGEEKTQANTPINSPLCRSSPGAVEATKKICRKAKRVLTYNHNDSKEESKSTPEPQEKTKLVSSYLPQVFQPSSPPELLYLPEPFEPRMNEFAEFPLRFADDFSPLFCGTTFEPLVREWDEPGDFRHFLGVLP